MTKSKPNLDTLDELELELEIKETAKRKLEAKTLAQRNEVDSDQDNGYDSDKDHNTEDDESE